MTILAAALAPARGNALALMFVFTLFVLSSPYEAFCWFSANQKVEFIVILT